MGNLIHKIAKKLTHQIKETKIIIVGLDGAGKTTILYKLKLGKIVTTTPTIGFNVETVKYKKLLFKVWDVGGQERIRCLWQRYYYDTQGIIFVIDSNDIERINNNYNDYYKPSNNSNNNNNNNINNTKNFINQHCACDALKQLLNDSSLNDCPLLIFANKQDLSSSLSEEEIIDRLELNKITDRKWHLQPTCAVTGEGIFEGLTWLSKKVKKSKNTCC